MTTPNHIAGGLVFTGVFCSLWNINIFNSPITLVITAVVSILPDADHTKSIIGKTLYPVAKFINKNYGHRTITHSLIALIVITIIAELIKRILNIETPITHIIFFAYLSHIILDMITLQGVALLFPFYKNPCVIPANPDLRFRTGNVKQEGIIFFILAFCTFFMQDLFKNGFWTNYNKSFNDIPHVYREFKTNPKALKVAYNYTEYNKTYNDTAFVIKAKESQLILLNGNYFRLEKNPNIKIKQLEVIPTNKNLVTKKYQFKEITEDSLNKIVRNKFINQLEIISNKKSLMFSKLKPKQSDYFSDSDIWNISFSGISEEPKKVDNSDSIKHVENQKKLLAQIDSKKSQYNSELRKESESKQEYKDLNDVLKATIQTLEHETDSYMIELGKQKIIELEAEEQRFVFYKSTRKEVLKAEINSLQKQLSAFKPTTQIQETKLLFTGVCEIILIQ